MRLRQTKPWLEAAHDPGKKADRANGRRRKGRGGEAGGGPEIDVGGQRPTRMVKIRWQHAGDGVEVAIHANFLADDVRVAAEAAVPVSVADDHRF